MNGLDDIGSSSVYLRDTLTQVILFFSCTFDSFDIIWKQLHKAALTAFNQFLNSIKYVDVDGVCKRTLVSFLIFKRY